MKPGTCKGGKKDPKNLSGNLPQSGHSSLWRPCSSSVFLLSGDGDTGTGIIVVSGMQSSPVPLRNVS